VSFVKKYLRAKIYPLNDGRYSVYLYYPIEDPALAETLGRDYQTYDIRVFKNRKAAQRFAEGRD